MVGCERTGGLPALGVEDQVGGVLESRADQDGGVEAVGLGDLHGLPLHVAPVQVLPDPVHRQGTGNRRFVDHLRTWNTFDR